MSRFVTIVLSTLLLAACNGEAPAPLPSESAPAAEADLVPVMGPERRILAVGDSLFAGYGLNPGESYPARLEVALRAQGINARISNAGVSGDTSAAGAQRFAFVLDSQSQKPDLVIIEFGGNDVLRGLPPQETSKNLDAMLAEANKRGLKVLLMGMLAPPNLGADFKAQFEPIYPSLAKHHGAALVPFFLAPVIGKPDLIQADHIHPTAHGVEEIVKANASSVAKALPR
ncbi:MAG: hypothetical protein RLZZ136_1666 [Pseudomonadota bacterium]